MRLIRSDDRWLFLTPEIEREVPGLLARVGEANEAQEAERIERLVHGGDIDDWFAYLRDVRARLERARIGPARVPDAERLAAVLREQYLLVPALRDDEESDAPERRRLEGLEWTAR